VSGCPDLDLVPVLVPFWLASLARVGFAIAHHESFGLDATLATVSLMLVPLLLHDAAVWCATGCVRAARKVLVRLSTP
jgi:hypothetical protein